MRSSTISFCDDTVDGNPRPCLWTSHAAVLPFALPPRLSQESIERDCREHRCNVPTSQAYLQILAIVVRLGSRSTRHKEFHHATKIGRCYACAPTDALSQWCRILCERWHPSVDGHSCVARFCPTTRRVVRKPADRFIQGNILVC